MHRKTIISVCFVLLSALPLPAQKWSLGTNAAQWLNFGTVNAELSVAAGRHASVGVGARYNPWTFRSDDGGQFQNRQRTAYLYGRWWPWFVYSGWWLEGRTQWREYNSGGYLSERTEEGNAVGGGLSAGYTLMVHKNLNLEFGAGFWTGYKWYTVYACPSCGRVLSSGSKPFIMPDNITLSMLFVF